MYIQFRPTILILDSGVGGLSIYTEIWKLLPSAFYLYFFDNQAFPYGEHSEIFIVNRLISIIEVIRGKYRFDVVVIACSTMSVVALQILRSYFAFPVIGVIPSIKLAARVIKNGIIGVLATHCTIHNYYIESIIKHCVSKFKHKIILLGASELVVLAESKIRGDNIPILMFRNIFNSWLNMPQFPDIVVLGCTHFYFLKKELTAVFPKNSYLMDSRKFVAQHTIRVLRNFLNFSIEVNYSNVFCDKNRAYCSLNTPTIKTLKTILLLKYNFCSLEVLLI